ncbi:hypothetical protein GE061_017703 [Apolygus lucorum]|uniref:Guanine deaminase n=1 Tax=Apolygus lucorum TaxID=248454 RepID=A0A8S9XBL9_APOLU|nr:hypothetical protein GE061_017703 [Apolygus lucorum]
MTGTLENCLVFDGPLVHSCSRNQITTHERALVVVENGKITKVVENVTGDVKEHLGSGKYQMKKLEKGQFLCPGFVDLHTHAPQFPNQGLGMDMPLLDWLQTYTFPLEMKYEDEGFAEKVYKNVVKSTLKSGTTTACYFGTIHRKSTTRLAQAVSRMGQRGLVGKVNMNQNSNGKYVEKTEDSMKETLNFIQDVSELNNPLVEPVITPRFAISCSMDLLKELGKLAASGNYYIQTHISENKAEVEFTKEVFPDQPNYAEVYNVSGLLTNKTILGHGIYLSDEEQKVIASKGTAVAHCPNSNTWLKSGICDVRKLWSNNVKVGLGTDIGAGSVSSIIDAMRSALAVSINKSFYSSEDYKPLTYPEVFFLATLGGAEALNKQESIGNFMVGKDFDALLIDTEWQNRPDMNAPTFTMTDHSLIERVQKLIYSGDDRNIAEVYVCGRLVSSRNISSK